MLNCVFCADKPHNPMLNSGAIMVAALALSKVRPELELPEKFEFMNSYLRVRLGIRWC